MKLIPNLVKSQVYNECFWALINNKYEALDAFKVFKAEGENQCGKKIQIVRSNRGGK